MEEIYNRDEADNIEKNSTINENEYMCIKGQFKGLKEENIMQPGSYVVMALKKKK